MGRLRKMLRKALNCTECGGGGSGDDDKGEDSGDGSNNITVHGKVVLMTKNLLDFNDFTSVLLDGISDLLGNKVSFQLVSSTLGDPNEENAGVVGPPAYLEKTVSFPSIEAAEAKYSVKFRWEDKNGVPGAVIVKNKHNTQFYLKSLTLEDFPTQGAAAKIHFVCNSWVYPDHKYSYDRVFFTNSTYLPANTPKPLRPYRDKELCHLRGDNVNRQLQEWDRVYKYAYYNDLGKPDSGKSFARPVLGGTDQYPYPRRGITGRPPTKTDPLSESSQPLIQGEIYVPRDERFGHLKMSDFLASAIKVLVTSVYPILESIFKDKPNEFNSFKDVLDLFEGGLKVPQSSLLNELRQAIPFELIKEVLQPNGTWLLKLPMPFVIQEDKWAWRTDEEFAREMLAGVNPVIICGLQEFPPTSKLDPKQYGNQTSTITAAHIVDNLEGLTVDQALAMNRLFILDHHDMLMPYVNLINNSTHNKIYATRTLLFLKNDGTLRPVAVELSLPNPYGEQHGAVSKVYTPADTGVEASIWQLAKAYVAVNDSGVHQLISHWLNTHAAIEPFVIATNRQLSALHPIYKLLAPHYRDTMNINALARQILINAGGILEFTVFPAKYAMEMSSKVYKRWNFVEQGLPADLLKRGVAVKDPNSDHGLRLLIKDYPYAIDGLSVWFAIETWVSEYCAVYYPENKTVQNDTELQAWWKEIREVGHGDKQYEPWWPPMNSIADLTQSCTIIIWIASALHAAVNFGQYPYAGYLPNRPTISRRFMPEPGTPEYDELTTEPDKVFLRTITSQLQTIVGVSLIEVLSTHSSDEVYLGQRDTAEWTTDWKALEAFERFGKALADIEQSVQRRNGDRSLRNRNGPVAIPYNLLYPSSRPGITGMGIPNSVSI